MRRVTQFLYAIQTTDIPVRVTDIQIDARSETADELTVQIGLATIYQPQQEIDPAAVTAGAVP